MLAELEAILQNLGAKLNKKTDPEGTRFALSSLHPYSSMYQGISKVLVTELKKLATAEDVSNVLNLYHEYFNQEDEEEDEPPISDVLPTQKLLNDSGGDLGMEVEASMSSVSLALSLGFKTGRPPLFNTFRDRSGITPWDDPSLFVIPESDPLPSNLSKLFPLWHQLAGGHSMVRSVFTPDKTALDTIGVLVADEVGLGKTAQSLLFIAFLNNAIWLRATDRKPPRLLS
jgi:TATA-binding protein-associated factor